MTGNGRHRVVVTGMGTINPLGATLDDFWDGLVEGRSTGRTIERFPTDRINTKFACMVDGFDPARFMDRKVVARTARFTQLALAASGIAIADAGIVLDREDRFRVGIEMGTGIGGFAETAAAAAGFAGGARISPFFAPMVIPNMAAGQVAMSFGLKGPNATIATACAASTHSLGTAMRIIERGDADIMLAGGAEASLSPFGIAAFNAIRALSTRNDDPARASRPFDRDRDGFVPGEGAGTLVLESLEHARARGVRVYGEVAGFSVTDDAFHQVAPDETGAAPARCITNALADAHVRPEEVDYVNAHGTSTPLNDASETRAIKMALGKHAYKVAVSSTKSMVGHLLGAAGAVEAIATLLMINRGRVHPTINLEHPDPACDLDYVPNAARRLDVRVAISNGFGFGGQNAVVVLKRFEEQDR
ncbi:MAG: beta-ketoacyl-ACP synthase II [Candidatus Dormibacterales bacterium]